MREPDAPIRPDPDAKVDKRPGSRSSSAPVVPRLGAVDQRMWRASLAGLALIVFSVVALSGPGRIDIVDGQTRYEVARSIVDHGDVVVRDANVYFGVVPGRGGRRYTTYRLPQTAAGVVAILAADGSGPVTEGRRHFFFLLIGAVACAVLAIAYAVWFKHVGQPPRHALLWAVAGILCTPNWFYGTSSFDDILGSTAVGAAVVLAATGSKRRPIAAALLAGVVLGYAFNCKQPLAVFLLPVLSALHDPSTPLKTQLLRVVSVAAGLSLGIAAYLVYELYKFPPGSMAANAELLASYGPVWAGSPLPGLAAFAASARAGAVLYAPGVVICLVGVVTVRGARSLALCTVFASAAFTVFIASLAFWKGDPSWGPRYLTPVFAVLWLFAPAGAARMKRATVAILLVAGFTIQLLALAADPQRLDLQLGLPSSVYSRPGSLPYHPAASHLLQRPREISEMLSAHGRRATAYSPAPSPTFATPSIPLHRAPDAVTTYHVFRSFRPWLLSYAYLQPQDRPVPRRTTAVLLTILLVGGLALALPSLHARGPQ